MADETAPSAYGKHPDSEHHTIEVVGWFRDRESFKAAVKDLKAQGFGHADLSVLDTHESISAADSPYEAFRETMSGLVDESPYIGPIAAAGFIAVAAGPVGALVSGAIAAGLTGTAIAQALKDVRATPHTDAFAKAAENGAILLWVCAEAPARQATAVEVLQTHGASDVHTHERPKQQPQQG
jgi:hypothetical protein